MQVQMWEHFAHQANQSNLNPDTAVVMVESLLNIKRFTDIEENLEFIKKVDRSISQYIIEESSNGRTPDFESGKCGSESYFLNPAPIRDSLMVEQTALTRTI
jgi:hypothetical protein